MSDYTRMRELLENALNDLAILSGDIMGPSDATWQDVAGTCAVNLRALASEIDVMRIFSAFPCFPSPAEATESLS